MIKKISDHGQKIRYHFLSTLKMIICREQAVCIFYCEDFNEENAARCSKKIENIGDVDICYLHDPTDPVLVFNTRIKALPYKFLRYASASKQSNPKIPSQEKAQETQEKQLSKFEK
jgi:hypothetical protein